MKVKLQRILMLFLAFGTIFAGGGNLYAQERTISGTVSDDSGALPGVSIIIKGASTGTETDFNGKYSIKTKTGDVLSFSYIGYITVERTVGTSNSINVIMAENENVLDEVVVTALGIKRQKRSLGFSQQTINNEDLLTSKQSDIVNAMAGKIAGIQFMGAPSSGFKSSKIRLRGDTNVLYVVDGIRLRTSDDVNPEDVATISVLKGSAATALYGPEGRNGAVIITTVRAKNGESTVRYDGSVEIGNADYIYELQSEYGGGYDLTFEKFSFNAAKDPASWSSFDGHNIVQYFADESWGPKLDGRLVRLWDSWIPGNPNFGKLSPWVAKGGISDLFETSLSTKHSVTFLKGGDNYNLKINLLRNDRTLNIPNSKRINNRVSVSAGFDVNSKLNISSNVSFQDRSTLNDPTEGYNSIGANLFQWWQAQLDVSKLKNYRQEGKIFTWNIKGPRNLAPKYWDSPYFEFHENLKHSSRRALIGNVDVTYKINDNFASKLSINKTFDLRKADARVVFGGYNTPSYFELNHTRNRDLLTGQLTYSKEISSFEILSTAGFEIDQYTREYISASTKNGLTIPGFYSIETSKERPNYSKYLLRTKSRAAYITAVLGYKKLLYFDASLRKDWSSTAKVGDNGVLSKGTTLSFVFSELIPKNDILSYGKLRGGVSEGPKFPNPYALSETYNTNTSFGSKASLSLKSTIFNSELKGGVRQEIEFGTELSFLSNRINLDITYFKKIDSDLPAGLSLDSTTGYNNVLVNSGKQTYAGIEFAISGKPIKTEDFQWESSFNFATLERRVVALAEGINKDDLEFLSSRWGGLVLRDEVGERWGEVYGRKILEVNGKKVLSSSANYVTEDYQSLGNYLPDFTGGFINSFKYKNFSLNIDMDYQVGGKFFSTTEMFINSSGLGVATVGNNEKGNPIRDPLTNLNGEVILTDEVRPKPFPYVKASEAGDNSGGIYVEGVSVGKKDEKGNYTDVKDVSYYIRPQAYWGSQFGNINEFLHDASYLSIRNIRLGYTFPEKLSKKFGFQRVSLHGYVNNAFLLFTSLPHFDPSQLEQRYEEINFREGGQLPGARTYGFNVKLTF